MLKKMSLIVKIFISGLIFYWVIIAIDIQEIENHFASISWEYPLAIIALLFLNLLIMTKKWHLFFGKDVKFRNLFQLYWGSDFMNLFFLGAIGGEIYKVILAKNKKLTFFSSLFDRLLAISFYIVIGVVLYFLIYDQLLLAIVILSIFFSSVFMLPAFIKFNNKKSFFFQYFTLNKPQIWLHLFLSFLALIIMSLIYYLLFLAFGIHTKLLYYPILVVILIIGVTIPISFQGIGVREFIFISFAGFVGIENSIAVAASLLIFSLEVVYKLSGVLPYFFYRKKV
jgi:uncharacterized membrane protein YbhN (UPF0104 family)